MLRKNLSLSRRRSFRSDHDRDDGGWSLLHIGAMKGDLKQVKRLLDDGMDVNVVAFGPKSKGLTPLYLAAEGGHLDVMDKLLDCGANIDARTKGAYGCNIFSSSKLSFLILITTYNLACNLSLRWFGIILSRIYFTVTKYDVYGCSIPRTPLHNAAKERKRQAVKFLIENGAFLPNNIDDCRFNPPLHYCPGLEWAYEEMKRLQLNNSSDGENSGSSEG